MKVIIIADEEKIKAKIEEYENVKEKLIRFIYLFDPELKEVFPNFINRYPDVTYRQFLTERSSVICDFFDKGKHKNLRTLRFVLDLFEPIFLTVSRIAQIDERNKKFLLNRFLLFVVTYSIEYKKKGKNENLEALKAISNVLGSSAFDLQLFRDMRAEMIEKGEVQEDDISPREKFTTELKRIISLKKE